MLVVSQVLQLIGEVNAGTLEFINLNIYEKEPCTYMVSLL
jgi:hypothetical protein